MRLYSEIVKALAGEGEPLRVHYFVVDGGGGYFQNVRRVLSFSEEEIVLAGKRGTVRVKGARLSLGKYFAGDAVIRGEIFSVERTE